MPANVAVSTADTPLPQTRRKALALDWLAVTALALLWLQVVSRLRLEWDINPQYAYGWIVPFLAAFLFWRRWQSRPNARLGPGRVAALVAAIAFTLLLTPIRLVQEANPDWRLLSWGLTLTAVLVTLAVIYYAGGLTWLRHFAFPILFFLVAVPWPTQFEQFVIQGLMRIVAAINVEFLNTIGIAAVQLGSVIEVGSGLVGIDEACTGVRSLQATLMVSLFLGEFYGFNVVRRLVLVCAGVLLAFVCNLIRTFILVYLGAERGFESIAKWHDPAGLSILIVCLFGLWGLSMLMQRGAAPEQKTRRFSSESAVRVPRIALALLLLFVVGAEAATQAWYRQHESAATRLPAWTVNWPTGARNYTEVAIAPQAQDLLRYNEGGGATWKAADGHSWTMYFFRWHPGQTAGLFLKNHRPDICLPASGMTQLGEARHHLLEVNGLPLPMRSYTFRHGADLVHVFYCYWDGSVPDPESVNKESWTPSGRLDSVRRGRRDVGTQMLEFISLGYEDEAAAARVLREQLAAVVRSAR